MITQQQLDYIRQQVAAGKSMEEIRAALKAAGWQDADIEEGIKAHQTGQSTAPIAPADPGTGIPGASDILREAWAIYKQHLGTFVGITVVPIVAVMLAAAVIGGSAFLGIRFGGNSFAPGFILLAVVLVIAAIYIGCWGGAALLVAIRDRAENLGIQEAFHRSQKYIVPFFITGLLTGLAVMGGFILFIIPGIIFSLWFSQSNYIVATEDLSGTAAMSKSKSYVQGRMWPVFVKLFFIGFITWVISLIVGLATGSGSENNPIGGLISGIVNVFWAPVVSVYGFLLFEHLKRTKAS